MENVENNNRRRVIIREIAYEAIFVAILAICSWISIPSTIPFTLQTLGVMVCLGLLGGRRGTIAIVAYILLGLIGVPVFANFTGGVAKLVGPTGGYIVGFIFTGLSYWLITYLLKNTLLSKWLGIFVGIVFVYLFGTIFFVFVYGATKEPISFASAFSMCVLPYLIPEVAKVAISFILVDKLSKYINL